MSRLSEGESRAVWLSGLGEANSTPRHDFAHALCTRVNGVSGKTENRAPALKIAYTGDRLVTFLFIFSGLYALLALRPKN
jgi:hypothetical protein